MWQKYNLWKYRVISVLYQSVTVSIELKICTLSHALASNLIWRCWMVSAIFSTINSGEIVRMQKNTLFYSWKMKHSGCQWCAEAVAWAVAPATSGSCSTDSTSRKDTTNVANMPKLQFLNDTSILTMICARIIRVLASKDNLFLACIWPFQLSTFPVTASRVCECDPNALEGGCTRKLEIVMICKWEPKQT